MSASIDQSLRQLAPDGVQITLWPCEAGYQANVAVRHSNAWTCATLPDPVDAVAQALRQRAAGTGEAPAVSIKLKACATEKSDPWPYEQIDIEEAIAAAPVPAAASENDDLEGLLG